MSLFEDASLIVTPNGRKAGKIYALKPFNGSGDLTVVRATTKTEVNASGVIVDVPINVPSFDYSNGSCPSILVEPQRTNLLLRSEEFENTYWIKLLGTITENNAIAPNGTMTADLFTKTSGVNTVSIVSKLAPYSTTGVFTLSVYIKPKVGNIVLLRLDTSANSANSIFNFTTKTFTNTGVNFISSSYKELSNGWFRLILVGNVINTNWSLDTCNLFSNPTGDAMWIWGAQLELGSNATSYIPTTTTSVTRNADVISKTGLSGITSITETFENGTTNVISGSPTSYTMSQGRIKSVVGI